MSGAVPTAHLPHIQHRQAAFPGSGRRLSAASVVPASAKARRQSAVRAVAASGQPQHKVLGAFRLPLLGLTAAAQILSAGPASAIDFQQPLALPPLVVEWARVAEDEKGPEEVIGNLTATPAPSPADIADAVNPANTDSPASDIANKVIENVQPVQDSAAKAIREALGNPVQEDAPKLQDAVDAPAELLKPGREVLVQRLQRDILPKIESQIAELSKQDEPNDATKAITKQLKSVQTDINRLVIDVQDGKTDAIQADASGLQQQFDALRKAIPRLNPKNSDKATIAEKINGGTVE